MVSYNDPSASVSQRARAYLAVNCSHCHRPNAWEIPSRQGFDFRYNSSFDDSGIGADSDEIREVLVEGEMPFIGTSMPDTAGIDLILQFLSSRIATSELVIL